MGNAATRQVWGPLLGVAVLLFVKIRRIGKERPPKLQYLWIIPVLVSAIVAALFVSRPPPPIGVVATDLLMGVAAGMIVFTRVEIHARAKLLMKGRA